VKKQQENKKNESVISENNLSYVKTFSSDEEAEQYRLRKDMSRSDMEKLKLFIQMLQRNAMYKKAKIYK
jgi:hypothetical protein